ncbi:hypothetical protein [Brachyspira sp. G79]|uniref:hypothetical protein n=1 Tax=Brachyspira sp. G79 TaxID=1358104 RepID=UPI000BBBC351|nr:hypothetical protein [Brachyspira sp. G79]
MDIYNEEFINLNKKLDHIKYGVDNSFIYTIENTHRFIVNMYQYMIDHPEEFSKDIEEFKKDLDKDSLEALEAWKLQRKLGAKYSSEFWRVPASTTFLTNEQKIIHSTKFQIYDSIINNYKNKYDIKDIGLTIHTHYYDCGLIYVPSYIKNTFKYGIAIDGGAYIGDTAIMLYEQYDFKSIYSFEPTNKSYSILSESVNRYKLDDRIKLYKYALSDKK